MDLVEDEEEEEEKESEEEVFYCFLWDEYMVLVICVRFCNVK